MFLVPKQCSSINTKRGIRAVNRGRALNKRLVPIQLRACIICIIRWNKLVQAQLFIRFIVTLVPRTVFIIAQLDLFFCLLFASSTRFSLSASSCMTTSSTSSVWWALFDCCSRRFFGFGLWCWMCLRCRFGSGTLLASDCTAIYITSTARLWASVSKSRDFFLDLSCCCIFNMF